MPLPFANKSTGIKKDGVLVSQVSIKDIKATYGEKMEWMRDADDIGLHMKLDIGKDFFPNFYVGGNYKKEVTKNGDTIVGHGSSMKVKILLTNLGFVNPDDLMNDDGTIPEDILESMIGRSFLRLSYSRGLKPDGTIDWSQWQETGAIKNGEKELKIRFFEAVEEGYLKNYKAPDDGEIFSPNESSTSKAEERFAL